MKNERKREVQPPPSPQVIDIFCEGGGGTPRNVNVPPKRGVLRTAAATTRTTILGSCVLLQYVGYYTQRDITRYHMIYMCTAAAVLYTTEYCFQRLLMSMYHTYIYN